MAVQNQAKKEPQKEPQKEHEPGCEKLGYACGAVGGLLSLVNIDYPGKENPYASVGVALIAAAVLLQKDKNGHTYLYNLMGAVEENAPRIAANTLKQSKIIVKVFGCAIRSAIQVTPSKLKSAKLIAKKKEHTKYGQEVPLTVKRPGESEYKLVELEGRGPRRVTHRVYSKPTGKGGR